MKTVFLTELSLSPKYTIQQIVIGLIVSIAITVGMSNIYCIVPILAVSITFSQAFTWVALDEQNGWERNRAALPLTRSQIMLGRMLAILVKLVIVVIVGIALQVIMSALGPIIASIIQMVDLTGYEFDAPYIVLTACISVFITAILIAFTIPFAARFGMTRALRYIPLGFAALVILGICFMGIMPGEEMAARFDYLINDQLTLVALAILLSALVIYALGTFVSVILYRHRQF